MSGGLFIVARYNGVVPVLSIGSEKRPPEPASGPINFLAYPVMEVNGKTIKVQTEFLFRRPG